MPRNRFPRVTTSRINAASRSSFFFFTPADKENWESPTTEAGSIIWFFFAKRRALSGRRLPGDGSPRVKKDRLTFAEIDEEYNDFLHSSEASIHADGERRHKQEGGNSLPFVGGKQTENEILCSSCPPRSSVSLRSALILLCSRSKAPQSIQRRKKQMPCLCEL